MTLCSFMMLNGTGSILTSDGSIVAANSEDVDCSGWHIGPRTIAVDEVHPTAIYALANVRLMAETNARIDAFVIDLW